MKVFISQSMRNKTIEEELAEFCFLNGMKRKSNYRKYCRFVL